MAKRWLGNAAGVYDVWTVTVSGTIISQTYSLTINGKSITYTADGSATATIILAGLQAAWAASQIPEFTELTAVALPAAGPYTSMTLTGNALGVPSTISKSTTGAATFGCTNTTPATGPNFFNNALNWSGNVAPANSDVLVFDNGSVGCLYGLSTVLTGVTVQVIPGYTGQIGLPFINSTNTITYAEYRTTSLTLAGGSLSVNGPGLTRGNFAFGSNTALVQIFATGQRPAPALVPVILITGGNSSSECDISGGDVALMYYAGTVAEFPVVNVSYLSNATVTIGDGAVLTTVIKGGGIMTIAASATTITQGPGQSGTLTISGLAAVTTLNVQGGTCNYNSTGTLSTANVSNTGILNFDGDPQAKTVTNPINVYGPTAQVTDNNKCVNVGVLEVTAHQTNAIGVQHGSNNVMSFT